MGVSGINMYGLWDYRFPTLGDRRPGRDLHADRHRDRVPSCSWTTRAFAGVAAPLRRVLRRPRVDASRAHDEAGPNRTGTSGSGDQPARCYRTASGTTSGSRTRVSRATASRPAVGRSRSCCGGRSRTGAPGSWGPDAAVTPRRHGETGTDRGSRWTDSNRQRPVYWTGARPVLASAATP